MLKHVELFQAWGLLLLRLSAGLMLSLMHGWSKVVGAYGQLFTDRPWKFVDGVAQLGFPAPLFFALCSALAEFLGGLLLAVGLFTRYAAFFVVINMSVAVMRHLRTDMRFELAALYLFISLFLFFHGAGALSLDRIREK